MRAVDTGILLALLEGSARARESLRRLRGTELATTEANLLELITIASAAPSKTRNARLETLERLRQRLTVLPVDSRATREVVRRGGRALERLSPHVIGMLGALEAAGCQELVTDDRDLAGGDWSFRVRVLTV